MILWSTPLFLVAGFFAYGGGCGFEFSWFLLVPGAFLCFGLWLVYSAVFVDDAGIQRRSEVFDGLGNMWFIFAALIIAVPIYEVLKLIRGEKREA